MLKRNAPSQVSSKRVKTKTSKTTKQISRYASKPKASIGLGFPQMTRSTLKYASSLFGTAVAPASNRFYRCNGLFDPDQTSAGHQPMYFDNLMNLYNHWVVIGARFKFTVHASTANTNPLYFTLAINDDTTSTSTSVDGVVENTSSAGYKVIPPGNVNAHTQTLSWSTYNAFGQSPLANANLRGSSTADPAEQQYFQVIIGPTDGVTSVTYYGFVEIEYDAIFFELKDLAVN